MFRGCMSKCLVLRFNEIFEGIYWLELEALESALFTSFISSYNS